LNISHDIEATPVGGLGLLAEDMLAGLASLQSNDNELFLCLAKERARQATTLSMVASSSFADPSVLVCAGAAISNLTTEGYPGGRYHGGSAVADEVELLAIERAKRAFRAQYANVQPHSCSSANYAVIFSLLDPGDTLLGLDLKAGGHLTHGAKVSCSGRYFRSLAYGLDDDGLIDYESARKLAETHRPKLIFCGASAYPRQIRFEVFRNIADSVGAILLADISHIAGLVVAGLHPSPIDVAHITTTSTYKQLFGPRGGLILMGRDRNYRTSAGVTLEVTVQKGIFPFFQGTPDLAAIAAKARALHLVTHKDFVVVSRRILANARALANALARRRYVILTAGTDNHIVLVSLRGKKLSGVVAERALEECGLIVNKNLINGDDRPSGICSGVRLGTNTLAARGMKEIDMEKCAELIDQVLGSLTIISDSEYVLSPIVKSSVLGEVRALCQKFPMPGYATHTEQIRRQTYESL
jgi:glycine hydroxymethyltransferase